jgi:hypothetical protein
MWFCIKLLSLCIFVMKLVGLIDLFFICDFFLILSEQPLFTVEACLDFPNTEHTPYFVSHCALRIKMITAKMYTL